jgi:hypothetical protein
VDDLRRWAELLSSATVETSAQPERICELCVRMLEVSGAGITMVTGTGNRGVVCATDDRAARIEDLQLTVGVGPCIDAMASRGPVLLPDLDDPGDVDTSRWLGFTDDVRRAGVQAVFAFPLLIGAITLGAIDLYRDSPGDLSAGQLAGALLAADTAAVALLHINTGSDDAFAANPETGADFRLQVHQATGMVAEQLGVGVDAALLRLRGHAFASGRALSEISDDVITRRIRFTSEEP